MPEQPDAPAEATAQAAPPAPEPTALDQPEAPSSVGAPQEREWWQEPGMPWRHKPTRADLACMTAIGLAGVYALIMLPLRPVLLGLTPQWLAALGHRTGIVMLGALAATGDHTWPWILPLAALSAAKFDWIYWWAGKLWGRGLIEVWSGRSERARRRNDRAERFAHKYESWAIGATYLPLPIPAGVVYAALGASGTSLRKFLTVDLISSLVAASGYLALGVWIGPPAVELMRTYGQYMWYLSIAIIVVMVGTMMFKKRPAQD